MTRHSVDVHLPASLGRKFERQLRHLVNGLATQGPSGRYLREEMFSKYLDDSLVPSHERKRAAVEKFLAAERRNSKTNERLLVHEPRSWGWCSYDTFVDRVRKIIAEVLGPLRYPEILMGSSHTNGASTRVKRSPASSSEKLTGRVHLSSSAVPHWLAAFSGTLMSSLPLEIVEFSELFTVPKKTEIDRCACKEPEGNMLLQRSVGNHIRDRLRRVGIDLRDQSVNRELARRAYRDRLATIDLSSASDTVSLQLVMNLLPFDWYWLLDDLRVKGTLLDGEVHNLSMFSSMGNGFTFELETLLFYAIARATAWLSGIRGRISVYGDDIIVPCTLARRLMSVLSWFGFIPNRKKTHIVGPFRESCGGHFWKGFDVTPFYVRRAVRTLPDLINILNSLLEWDCRGWGFFTTEEAYRFWESWRCVVPQSLWGGADPRDPTRLVTEHGPRKRLMPVTRRVRSPESGRFLNWLLTAEQLQWRDEPLFLDPHVEVGYRLSRVVSCGVRSSYTPGIAWGPASPDQEARWGP